MKTLEEAKKDLEDFLNKHPHMREKQKEIDRILNNTPDEDRLTVVLMLLAGSQNDLLNALKELVETKTD